MTTTAAPVKAKSGRSLGADLTAGITVALVTIPDAMATAILAGVSPINGLYSLMVGMILAGMLIGGAIAMVAVPQTEIGVYIKLAILLIFVFAAAIGLWLVFRILWRGFREEQQLDRAKNPFKA